MRSFIIVLCSVLFSSVAFPQSKVGLGIVVGVPSGISGTIRLGPSASANVQLAWDVDNTFFTQVHYDMIIVELQQSREQGVDFYGGPGAFVRVSRRKSDSFGFSGNFGIRWLLSNRLELFTEIAPKVGLVTRTEIDVTGGLGFRYMF